MTSAPTDPLHGRLVDGRYRVAARIARGGMATVYVADDLRLDRQVAIKVMHGHLADDEAFRERFVQEARSAARLAHPNVVSVFDQGQDDEMAYMVMEYLPGMTLRDLLKDYGRLTTEQTLDIMEAVLGGLAAAHKAGIVHRDVKPENVLLADDGRIKIGDFGLARAASANTATGQALLGTIAYLSPELLTRGVADARSDIYAAGIMMYEMLVGEQPYLGEQPMQIAFQHANETVPAPSVRVAGIPEEVDELVRWATAKSPDDRPHDARILLDRLLDAEGMAAAASRASAAARLAGAYPTTVMPAGLVTGVQGHVAGADGGARNGAGGGVRGGGAGGSARGDTPDAGAGGGARNGSDGARGGAPHGGAGARGGAPYGGAGARGGAPYGGAGAGAAGAAVSGAAVAGAAGAAVFSAGAAVAGGGYAGAGAGSAGVGGAGAAAAGAGAGARYASDETNRFRDDGRHRFDDDDHDHDHDEDERETQVLRPQKPKGGRRAAARAAKAAAAAAGAGAAPVAAGIAAGRNTAPAFTGGRGASPTDGFAPSGSGGRPGTAGFAAGFGTPGGYGGGAGSAALAAPPVATSARQASPGAPRPGGAVERLQSKTAKRRRRGWWIVGLILILVAAGGSTGWYFSSGPGGNVALPSVAGSTPADAEATLAGLGLQLGAQESATSPTVPAGTVLGTDPASDAGNVPNGSVVSVVVSAGPAQLPVPALVGSMEEAARASVAGLFTVTDSVGQFAGDVAAGTVMQALGADGQPLGATYGEQQSISFVVSLGAVPDVVGKSPDDANTALAAVGLASAAGSSDYSETVASGDIISVTLPASPIVPGNTITLNTSKGPAPVPVPDVTTKTWADAKAELQNAGFTLAYNQLADLAPAAFTVRATDPAPGTTLPRGSRITVSFAGF